MAIPETDRSGADESALISQVVEGHASVAEDDNVGTEIGKRIAVVLNGAIDENEFVVVACRGMAEADRSEPVDIQSHREWKFLEQVSVVYVDVLHAPHEQFGARVGHSTARRAPLLLDLQHDLAAGVPARDPGEGLAGLLEWQHCLDLGTQRAGFHEVTQRRQPSRVAVSGK